jgi:hypothetical protein
MKEEKTIIIGYGESEDPLPEEKKLTKYWVFASPCKKCGCSGREILVQSGQIILKCEECQEIFITGLPADEFHEITYIYWCNRSKFKTDMVCLTKKDLQLLKKIEEEFGAEYEMPRWAVQIVGGRCCKSGECVNFSCVFNKGIQ